MPKAAATDEPNVEETTYHNISQHITTYHNISQHTAQTTSGTRSMEGEIQVMNNDTLHILIAPICTGLCKWLPSNNSSEKRMLKRSSLATCRAFCTLSQFAPAPQELEGKTLRLLPCFPSVDFWERILRLKFWHVQFMSWSHLDVSAVWMELLGC